MQGTSRSVALRTLGNGWNPLDLPETFLFGRQTFRVSWQASRNFTLNGVKQLSKNLANIENVGD